jgi:hypothetical protein
MMIIRVRGVNCGGHRIPVDAEALGGDSLIAIGVAPCSRTIGA